MEPIPATMRVARFLGAGRVVVETRPVPSPAPGEVLVRVHACAICGSDRGGWERGTIVTPGHEGTGVVVAASDGVTLPLGTPGALYLVAYCGVCRMCRRGESGACLRKERMIGFTHDGAFADYVLAPERCFLPIDQGMGLAEATMLLDVLGTTMHAIRRCGRAPSQIAAACVIGAGPIGLGAIVALRGLAVPLVLAVDLEPYRLDLATRLGAVGVDGRQGDVVAQVRAYMADGPDIVIEASGHPAAQRQALDMVAGDGVVVIVGHSSGTLELRTSADLIAREIALVGSEYFDVREFRENMALVRTGRLDASPIITHRFPLDRIQDAFAMFWSGQSGKVLVCP